jgi:hypothetical protein
MSERREKLKRIREELSGPRCQECDRLAPNHSRGCVTALREVARWALDRLIDAHNVCYGGVTLEEIEERERQLEKLAPCKTVRQGSGA